MSKKDELIKSINEISLEHHEMSEYEEFLIKAIRMLLEHIKDKGLNETNL